MKLKPSAWVGMRQFVALAAMLAIMLPLAPTAKAHSVVCTPASSGDMWVWGSFGICTDVVEYISTDSTLYRWDGSSYNWEDHQFGACFACQNHGVMKATPSGAGWRWVEGLHTASHHGTVAPGISGYEFYRP